MAVARPRVVILGCGYAGLTMAQNLDHPNFEVTVIERQPTFFHNQAALRACADSTFINKCFIPYDKSFKHVKIIHKTVVEVTADKVIVEGADEPITFDYLVLATGSTYPHPGKTSGKESLEDAKARYEETGKKIKDAQKILIVGGGPVGVELAGEIADHYPKKEITLVHSHDKLLQGPYSDGLRAKLLGKLQKELKVTVILGEKVQRQDEAENTNIKKEEIKIESMEDEKADKTEIKETETKEDTEEKKEEIKEGKEEIKEVKEEVKEGKANTKTYTTDKGRNIETDLAIFCGGSVLNNQFLRPHLANVLDEQGFVKVNPQLQVEGFQNIFCIGDLNNFKETKVALHAEKHASIVASNIKALQNRKSLTAYKGMPIMILVTLGRTNGAAQFPGIVLGGTVTSMIKGKGLFVPRMWGILKMKQQYLQM